MKFVIAILTFFCFLEAASAFPPVSPPCSAYVNSVDCMYDCACFWYNNTCIDENKQHHNDSHRCKEFAHEVLILFWSLMGFLGCCSMIMAAYAIYGLCELDCVRQHFRHHRTYGAYEMIP